jgi:hypothetical protein
MLASQSTPKGLLRNIIHEHTQANRWCRSSYVRGRLAHRAVVKALVGMARIARSLVLAVSGLNFSQEISLVSNEILTVQSTYHALRHVSTDRKIEGRNE